MADWVKVAAIEELPEGKGHRFEVSGTPVAVFRIGDEVFAIGDTCSHAEASLSEGELWDYDVECPRHGSEFDVRSGEPRSLPATRPVPAYPVKVENGSLYLLVEEGP
ncbi:MAG: non-heme iron oxygenase ferredoxin subunit [Acidimicrobiia bacterium]